MLLIYYISLSKNGIVDLSLDYPSSQLNILGKKWKTHMVGKYKRDDTMEIRVNIPTKVAKLNHNWCVY